MKLPFELPFGKKVKSEYFLALILRDEKINAVVFEEREGKLRTVGEHNEYLPDSIDAIPYEDLLKLIDKTLSIAENSLPEGIETQKTIFGVKADWVHETQIKKDHLSTLKKLSDTLGLSPIGFLVIPEAITHVLSREEGAPTSGILLEIGKKSITASIIRAGKVLETKKSKIEDSVPQTTDRILHHFTNHEILPSRLIILDGDKNEALQQEFITHSWSKSLPFLHVPQITTLPKRYDAKAILFGAATQMGFDLLYSEDSPVTTVGRPEGKTRTQPVPEDVAAPRSSKNANVNDFGFVVNGDIEAVSSQEERAKTEEIEQEILENTETEEIENTPEEIDDEPFVTSDNISTVTTPKQPSPFLNKIFSLFSLGSLFSRGLFSKISIKGISNPLPNLGGSKKPILILAGVVVVLIGLFVLYTSITTATVTIYLTPKAVEKTEKIVFSPTTPSDIAGKKIFVETVSVDRAGSISTNATGTKEVGEKAKGGITILSSLTKEQTIPEGTTVTSSNGLAFVLDNAVKIASSSGISDIKSVSASVTAKDIGKEHNLPSGTKFSVGTFDRSSVEGKNDSAFGGGSKKEITVVAQKDVDKLIKDLPQNLEKDAQDEINKNVSDDKELLKNFFTTKLTKRELDKEVLEEAKTVTLKATVTYEGFSYKKDDLRNLFSALLGGQDFAMTVDQSSFQYETVKALENKNGEIEVDFKVSGGLIPKLNSDDIAKSVQGKSFDDAKNSVSGLPQVSDVEISLSPSLPFLPKHIPSDTKKIKIEVKTNG